MKYKSRLECYTYGHNSAGLSDMFVVNIWFTDVVLRWNNEK